MGYQTVPHYNSMSPEERDRWRKKLAQRLQKPAGKVTKQDFLKANSFKYPSMIYLALDIGARPCEINRMEAHWIDLENEVVRIPKEDAAKNREDWICQLTFRTWLRKMNGADTIIAIVPKRIAEVLSDRVFIADIYVREHILL
jgi:integrase